jgi:hypothetical protein
MSLTEKIKKIAASTILATSLLMPIKAIAQSKSSIDAIFHQDQKASYLRLNTSYDAPGKIKGYTAMEMYLDGKGYFGKTTLTKSLSDSISAKAVITHANEPLTQVGIGATMKVPTPKKTSLSFTLLPLWTDKKGDYVDHKVIAGYAIGADLGKGWSVSSFGETNVAAKGGPQWAYGEMSVAKKITDKLSVSYNPALRYSGTIVPKLEHRISTTLKL